MITRFLRMSVYQPRRSPSSSLYLITIPSCFAISFGFLVPKRFISRLDILYISLDLFNTFYLHKTAFHSFHTSIEYHKWCPIKRASLSFILIWIIFFGIKAFAFIKCFLKGIKNALFFIFIEIAAGEECTGIGN